MIVLLVVAAGGAAGSLARYLLDSAADSSSFPWMTLTINIVGCALIGVLAGTVRSRADHYPLLLPFLGTGVLGGFTTMSAYAVQTVLLDKSGRTDLAVLYACASLVLCLAAAYAALTLTARGAR